MDPEGVWIAPAIRALPPESGPRGLSFTTLMPQPTQTLQSSNRARGVSFVPWLTLAAGTVALVAVSTSHSDLAKQRDLSASILTTQDADEDGITDRQEYTFGTSPFLKDSDSDGIEDGEELALGTSPVVYQDVPGNDSAVGISLLAHGGMGNTHVEMMLFSRDGNLDDKPVAVSMLTSAGYFQIDLQRVATISTIREVVRQDGAILQTWTIPLSPNLVLYNQELHWIGAIGQPGGNSFSAAATVRLIGNAAEGTVFWTRSGHTLPPTTTGSAPPDDVQIDQPIPPLPGENPVNPPGNPGEVCVQITQVVGAGSGSTVITEVISANCQPGWAAFCSASVCASNVGTTFEKINPRNLLGG